MHKGENVNIEGQLQSDGKIIAGSTYPELAMRTAAQLKIEVLPIEHKVFPNSEQYVRYKESVRGESLFIFQTLAAVDGRSVDDALMEVILLIDAAKRASAKEVSVVLPYMAYSRQDRKARGREPISAAAVVRMLQSAGADRIVTVDMHSAQTQGVFNGPFDHLTAEPIIEKALIEYMKDKNKADFVVVSPDGGRAKISEEYADGLGLEVFHMPKSRNREDSSKVKRPESMGDIDGKVAIIIDDMIDTAGTLVSATEVLQASGTKEIICCATHGIFSGSALERIANSHITKLFISDTIPTMAAKEKLGDRLEVLKIDHVLAWAVAAISNNESVSSIFGGRNYH